MSKQYLTTHSHTLPTPASHTDIFAVAPSPTTNTLLIASGSSTLHIYSTASASYPQIQTLEHAHPLGCHHLAAATAASVAVSVGFGGEVRIWRANPGSEQTTGDDLNAPRDVWAPAGEVRAGIAATGRKSRNPGACWAVALSANGRILAGTSHDGRVRVWDLEGRSQPLSEQAMLSDASDGGSGNDDATGDPTLLHEFETRGGFGMGVDVTADGGLVASVHRSGGVYLFSVGGEQRARLLRSLPGLHAPGRTVAFSPAGTLLAAAGDSGHVALYAIAAAGQGDGYGGGRYDRTTGDQIAILRGHGSWITSVSWSDTGEWIASCAWDGKVRVWSTERRECVSILRGPEVPGEGTAGSGGDGGPAWAVGWLPVKRGGSEGFVVGGRKGGVRFYREAAGG